MSEMRGKLHWKIVAGPILALGCLYALGWSSDPHQALASQAGGGFCQVTDAGDLLTRQGQATPADTVKLIVSKPEVRPGMVIQARLINTTQFVARFGSEFKIQRYGRNGWMTDPSSPDGPWPRKVGKLMPDRAAGCYRFSVPAGQHLGRYRFLTSVDLGSSKRGRVAEFAVQGTR